jgi:hypothetical protein
LVTDVITNIERAGDKVRTEPSFVTRSHVTPLTNTLALPCSFCWLYPTVPSTSGTMSVLELSANGTPTTRCAPTWTSKFSLEPSCLLLLDLRLTYVHAFCLAHPPTR